VEPLPVLYASIDNNAQWCHTVCAAAGVVGSFGPSMWSSSTRTPLLYPDAITLAPQINPSQVVAAVDTAGPGCSVKDSFAAVDLAAYGFYPLFDASWISLDRIELASTRTWYAQWSTITNEADLEKWITAWGDSAVFRFSPRLLTDARVRFLAGYRDDDLLAGAIAFATASVIGINNVFGPEASLTDVWSDVAQLMLTTTDHPLVGYESGTTLAAARAIGFTATGPLTVWST
jgi:hypothetical protein